MARQNRRDVFDPHEVSVMHCTNRGVRRAMLMGYDPYTKKSYAHRREWVQNRLRFLAAEYGIDVLGYAIMGNHLHVMLRNRPDIVKTWSDGEVARRIWNLFPKRKDNRGLPAEPKESELDELMDCKPTLLQYRERLSDISWLMGQLAGKIARMANREDDVTGRFWEGRFGSVPLLDDAAILGCSSYVDLNPVRAGIAETPEESDYTSVQVRIKSVVQSRRKSRDRRKKRPTRKRKVTALVSQPCPDDFLAPIFLDERGEIGPNPSQTGRRASDKGFLPITLEDYLELVDWTGRQIAKGKRGRIPAKCQPILDRIGLSQSSWCEFVKNFGRLFKRVAGRQESLDESAKRHGIRSHRSSGGAELLAAG